MKEWAQRIASRKRPKVYCCDITLKQEVIKVISLTEVSPTAVYHPRVISGEALTELKLSE